LLLSNAAVPEHQIAAPLESRVMTVIMLSAMYENGGNVTHRMLDGHPELYVYPFESQLGTDLVCDFLTSVVPVRYRWPELPLDGVPETDYELFWDEELKTYLRLRSRSKFRDCGLDMTEEDRRREFLAYLQNRPRTRRTVVEALFHATFITWRNLHRSGSERAFVGFSPMQVLDVDKFFADFPDGHMIHVVRRPVSAYADSKKRPFPISLERWAWMWNLCQLAAAAAEQQYPGRFHVLRFEELAGDPESSLGLILDRMGFSWSDTCATPTFNRQALNDIRPWGVLRSAARDEHEAESNLMSRSEQERVLGLTRVMSDLMYMGTAIRHGADLPGA
jgi:hypothetical protein